MKKRTHTGLRYFFALILITTAFGKLLDNRGFAEVLATYRLFPETGLLALALSISLSELLLGGWLLRRRFDKRASLLVLAINGSYLMLAAVTLYRGIPLQNCGCFGVFLARPLSVFTLIEDGILVALSVAFVWLTKNLEQPNSEIA